MFLLYANEVGSSNAMELEDDKRSSQYLEEAGLHVDVFISDRCNGIAKWIRDVKKSF